MTVQPSEPLRGCLTPRSPTLARSCCWKVSGGGADGESAGLPGLDDLIHKPVVGGVLRGKDLVPFDVAPDLVLGAPGVAGEQRLEQGAHAEDLAGLDLDVAALSVTALGGRL